MQQMFGAGTAISVVVLSLLAAAILGPIVKSTLLIADLTLDVLTIATIVVKRQGATFALTVKSAGESIVAAFLIVGIAALSANAFHWCAGNCVSQSNQASTLDFLLALVVAPLAESILCQGFVYDLAMFWTGKTWLAVTIAGAAFLLIHGMVNVELVVASGVLTILRVRSQSLGPVTTAHFLVNAAVTVLGFVK